MTRTSSTSLSETSQAISRKYRVRDASVSDVEQIVAIGGCDNAPALTADAVIDRLDGFPEGVKVVCEKDTEELVGYLFAEIWDFKISRDAADFSCRNELSRKHGRDGTELHISSVAIAVNHRDLGLSDLLLTSAIMSLRCQFTRLRSVVAVASPRCRTSRHFFSKRRFIVVDSLPGFGRHATSRTEITLVMRKFFGLADPLHLTRFGTSPLIKQDFALA